MPSPRKAHADVTDGTPTDERQRPQLEQRSLAGNAAGHGPAMGRAGSAAAAGSSATLTQSFIDFISPRPTGAPFWQPKVSTSIDFPDGDEEMGSGGEEEEESESESDDSDEEDDDLGSALGSDDEDDDAVATDAEEEDMEEGEDVPMDT